MSETISGTESGTIEARSNGAADVALKENQRQSAELNKILQQELKLPCGAILTNRLCKAAMTEGLADIRNRATEKHQNLYKLWSQSGAGMLLTGNVQIDRKHLERPGNVAIAGEQDEDALESLRQFARAGTQNGAHLWMQISHAGRQTPAPVNPRPHAPSEVRLHMPGAKFGRPQALTNEQIEELITRFGFAAKTARETGFTGVQIHAAHGYLLSEFLSPHVNQRKDRWGGSLENRARLLLRTVRAMREATAPDFPISVKLNSADFQKGGFAEHEAVEVARMLEREGVDLLEISGGTYEAPAMMRLEDIKRRREASEKLQHSTIAREAYFLKYAATMREAVSMPLMVTGGFRSREGMARAIQSGAMDVAGIARPFCADPYAARNLLNGVYLSSMPSFENTLRLGPTDWLSQHSPIKILRAMAGWGKQAWFCVQLLRMGGGDVPDLEMHIFRALMEYQKNETNAAKALAP